MTALFEELLDELEAELELWEDDVAGEAFSIRHSHVDGQYDLERLEHRSHNQRQAQQPLRYRQRQTEYSLAHHSQRLVQRAHDDLSRL